MKTEEERRKKYDLPVGVVRICAGIVEAETELSFFYRQAIIQAEQAVGSGYAAEAELERKNLVVAIKLSLVNQKEWSYERLRARFELPVGKNMFWKEKRKFCYMLASNLKLVE